MVNQLLGMVVTLGWANEGLSYWAYVPATIKVGCYFFLSDVYSFNSPPSCVVCLHRLHCDCFPVYLVLCLPCMYSNPIVCIITFARSFLQHSSSFSNIHACSFSTGYLVHNSSFLPHWLWLLCLYQGLAGIRGVSERIEQACRPLGIRITVKSRGTHNLYLCTARGLKLNCACLG